MLGVHLTILIGRTVPVPAPAEIAEALVSVAVTHNDEGRSGFQVVFEVGRPGAADLSDYRLLRHPLLEPFNRVILGVVFDATPSVLIDGFITNQQFVPGSGPGAATFTITGEDLSVMMDLEERRDEYPGLSDAVIAGRLLSTYAALGLRPDIVSPPEVDQGGTAVRTRTQQGTDLAYLRDLARRHGYVFYVEPDQAPGFNTAYWGPPVRIGVPQRALSVNLGPQTNVDSINFSYDALAPTVVRDAIQDSETHATARVVTTASTRQPQLAKAPALTANRPNIRTRMLSHTAGLSAAEARTAAQAITDRSVDEVVTAEGELDPLRYGGLLKPRRTVGLRGTGSSYDGVYYVKSVSHAITKGRYRQRFTLTREGTGAMASAVRP